MSLPCQRGHAPHKGFPKTVDVEGLCMYACMHILVYMHTHIHVYTYTYSTCLHSVWVGLGLPSWVYPIEILQPFLGSKDEQHILAATAPASSKQQAIKKSFRGHRGSKPTPKYLKTTAQQMCIYCNRIRRILSRQACSMANLVSKNGRFWAVFRPTVLKTHDDQWCVK